MKHGGACYYAYIIRDRASMLLGVLADNQAMTFLHRNCCEYACPSPNMIST
jgi:hypothetical protein